MGQGKKLGLVIGLLAIFLTGAAQAGEWKKWQYFGTKDNVRVECRYYVNGKGEVTQCQWRATNHGRNTVRVVVRDTKYKMSDGSTHKALVSLSERVPPSATRKAVSDSLPGGRLGIKGVTATILVEA